MGSKKWPENGDPKMHFLHQVVGTFSTSCAVAAAAAGEKAPVVAKCNVIASAFSVSVCQCVSVAV